jgi:4-hydroxyacetophenone monooxygenase
MIGVTNMDAAEAVLDAERRCLPMADSPALKQALLEANVQTLLMVYVHLTHDEGMLDQFKAYIRPPFALPATEIPEEYLQELRDKLRHVLTTPGAVREDDPPTALITKMMNVGTGEPVTDEFVPMSLEQNGFAVPPPRKEMPSYVPPPSGFKVLVIGAGLTGLLAGIKLEEAGIDYVTIEKNEEVGGTWWENRYPGVGVDTPSHFYSYSFEINPDWNHYHPKGHDMQDYFMRVADKYKLRNRIRFNTKVTALHYDEAAKLWNVTVVPKDGTPEVLRVSAVINAHGPLNRWKWPDIPGFDEFKGIKLHTAAWDESLDLAGKKVAVIGTGASAAQLIPAVAPQVEKLTVFMRAKHWVLYNPEIMAPVTEGVKWALRYIPHYREWFRFRVFWFAADGLYPNVVKDPAWPTDGIAVSALNEGMRQYSLAHMQHKLADRPDLVEKLTPDFPIFSKRVVFDGGWYDALKLPNVTLEDTPIERITAAGIRMKDGREIEADILACATGFNVAKMTGGMEITGRAGHDLNEEWGEDDPRAYMGITVPGYPNYFLTVGPGSAPNHAAGQNLISESQIHYIIECFEMAFAAGKSSVEPTQKAFLEWNEKLETRMPQMIWTHPKANSYYNNSKGRIFMAWPFRLVDYWNHTRKPDPAAYRLE